MELELRTAKSHVAIRGKQLCGVAIPYGVETQIGSGSARFTEVVQEGAAKSVVDSNADVRCLFNHDTSKVLGRTASGTLSLESSHRGLEFSCVLPAWADDIHESVRRGDITGMSFGFTLTPEDQRWEDRKGQAVRHINNISNLLEISVVPFPAYPSGTSVDARAAALNTVPAEVRSAALRLTEPHRRAVDAEFDRVMKLTVDFVIDELHVPLQWDENLRPRPIEDQLKLMRKAAERVEMREQGWTTDVVLDELGDGTKWPRIVYAPTQEERSGSRRRQRFLRDFLLN